MKSLDIAQNRVFSDNNKLYTISSCPGIKVYNEKIIIQNDIEYREWSPYRSKLSAYIKLGGKCLPIREDSKILYLGASSGTTVSHVSDIVVNGKVYCVEFSPRMFRDLIKNCEKRQNTIPILGDATKPLEYQFIVDLVDLVYADVAQKRQVDIIADNMELFNAKYGIIAIKARSEDVASPPYKIFTESKNRLKERGFKILDSKSLEPYEKDHEMIVFEAV